jgi:hypothetical protein
MLFVWWNEGQSFSGGSDCDAMQCNECEVLMDCANERTNLLAVTSESEAKMEVEVELV